MGSNALGRNLDIGGMDKAVRAGGEQAATRLAQCGDSAGVAAGSLRKGVDVEPDPSPVFSDDPISPHSASRDRGCGRENQRIAATGIQTKGSIARGNN
ncbi:hypothetical protein D3C84_839570 [compost metagenome]